MFVRYPRTVVGIFVFEGDFRHNYSVFLVEVDVYRYLGRVGRGVRVVCGRVRDGEVREFASRARSGGSSDAIKRVSEKE